MNRNDDFDRTLSAWLGRHAPPEAPDRVLAAALRRVDEQPQRGGWFDRLQEGTRMSLILRTTALAAVISIAALVGLQLADRVLAPNMGGDPAASALPGSAVRPAVPAGWTTLATEERDIRLVVPPDIALVHAAPGSLTAQAPMRDGVVPFEIMVVGPGEELGRRGEGESMLEYLTQRGYLPQPSEGLSFGPTVERETILPSGRAVELRTSVQPGTAEEGRAVHYLIETESGPALLRFVGTPSGMEERISEMELISRLVEFGD